MDKSQQGFIPAGRERVKVDTDTAIGWVERGPRVVLYQVITNLDGEKEVRATLPLPADPILLQRYLSKGFSLIPPTIRKKRNPKI